MAVTLDPGLTKLAHDLPPGAAAGATQSHWQIPTKGAALKLVPADFVACARELGIETAAVHAVALVESSGGGFDDKSRPKLRYENHHFRKLTHHKYDKSHPDLSNAYKSKLYRATHSKGTEQQWQLLHAAFALAPDEAVQACSWGMFQVMGEAYKAVGWKSLEEFVKDMFYSEQQHMRAFMGFCRSQKLLPYLKEKPPNFTAFAHGYNGAKTVGYDVKMRSYYKQFSK